MSERTSRLTSEQRAILAQRVREATTDGRALDASPRIPTRPTGAASQLTTGQERLWFLSKLAPDTPAYTMYRAVRLTGVIDEARLANALNAVVARHEALRTTFVERGGRVSPVVADSLLLDLESRKVGPAAGTSVTQAAQDVACEVVRRPFNLSTGPLIRAALIEMGDGDYVFVLALHHIVSDERSLDILWVDLLQFYDGGRIQNPADSDESRQVEYLDYAHWQRERWESGDLGEQVAYWKSRLAGLGELALRLDHQRPRGLSFSGALEKRILPQRLVTELDALRSEQGVTRFMLILSAFNVLLRRYTDQGVVAIGVPASMRVGEETTRTVGFFLNTLVITNDDDADLAFTDFLRQVRSSFLDALANQEAPFEKLVDEIRPQRSLNRNPLFQAMCVEQQPERLQQFAPGISSERFEVTTAASKFDLTLFATGPQSDLTASAPELELTLEYNTDILNRATAARMLRHLEALLESIVSDPEAPLSVLNLVDQAELEELGAFAAPDYDQTDSDLPLLHELVEASAAAAPDEPAVIADETTLTYGGLNRRANRLARELVASGLEVGAPVAVCFDRSPAMVVAALAVLKAGGVYVPLDPDYPADRLQYLIDDCGAGIVIVSDEADESLPGSRAKEVRLRNDGVLTSADPGVKVEAGDDSNLDVDVSVEDLAYVIYTSGSTGRPKGVMVTHSNVVSSTLARRVVYGRVPERFLLLSSIAFDSSIVGLFWPLCTGGSVVLPRRRQEQDIDSLVRLIQEQHVTHTLCIPSLYKLILLHGESERLGTLETVIVAGEACPAAAVRLHFEKLPATKLYNEYGPTEATVWCIVHEVAPRDGRGQVPIGRPTPNAVVRIIDACGRPAPIGVAGEIYVGGRGVSRGYLERPDLTEERFVTGVDATDHEARYYRTGDRGRFTESGTIEFLGRIDNQTKVRGYRIEPDEISAVLEEHQTVAEAAVIVRREGSGAVLSDDPGSLASLLADLDPAEAEALLETIERSI